MTLIANWKAVLKYGWSYKLAALAALLTTVDTTLQLIASSQPSIGWKVASGISAMLAVGARFIRQKELSGELFHVQPDAEKP